MLRTRTLATLGLIALAALAHAQQEIRAVWVHMRPESGFSGPADVRAFVDKVANAHFNTVYPWVTSEYMAALRDPKYLRQEPNARWDVLEEFVNDCRERGLNVLPWYSFTAYKTPSSPEFDRAMAGNPDWAARLPDEVIPNSATGKVVPKRMRDVWPANAAARQWELSLIMSIFARYPDITGIHIEEPGVTYKQTENINGDSTEDKVAGTTAFMRALHAAVRSRYPGKLVTCNGGSVAENDRLLGRDWRTWAREGLLDYYVAQVYTNDPTRFGSYARRVLQDLQGTPVVLGIGIKWSAGSSDPGAVTREIEDARQYGAAGVALFSGESLTSDFTSALVSGPFSSGGVAGGGGAPTARAIRVVVNGSELTFDSPPVMQNGRVLVPLRGIFEALGSTVQWTERTQTVAAKRGSRSVKLRVGNRNAVVNGRSVTMDVPPIVRNGRTLVPIRFVSQALGAKVNWEAATSTVTIHQ